MTTRTFPLSRQRRRRAAKTALVPTQDGRHAAPRRDAAVPTSEGEHGSGATPTAPRLPHEHDEHTDVPHAPRAPIVQAEADLAQGRVDTDRRQDAAQVFDEASRRRRGK